MHEIKLRVGLTGYNRPRVCVCARKLNCDWRNVVLVEREILLDVPVFEVVVLGILSRHYWLLMSLVFATLNRGLGSPITAQSKLTGKCWRVNS
jgi:hypothetical protein